MSTKIERSRGSKNKQKKILKSFDMRRDLEIEMGRRIEGMMRIFKKE